ncbi:MAG: hypothetical protein EKK46_09510 [Rhodocyclaceae bacterium]|nr:MAG: hypothetical protein EKK46_09510 [Rhodocyclaceae bacterium]
MRSLMLALSAALLLTACGGGDDVSYLVGGSKTQYLSVQRERTWLWSDWQVSVVVSRYPDCVRRHHVKNVSKDVVFKVELYRPLEGGFILHQGKRWYVADTAQCQLQQFEEPPAEPGDLLGTFAEVNGALQFKAEDAAKGKAAGS